jgi:hypothetical protein
MENERVAFAKYNSAFKFYAYLEGYTDVDTSVLLSSIKWRTTNDPKHALAVDRGQQK